jgi:phospholipid/cholesterol/gamma-HCH transport system substrate-binding protein
VVRHLPGIKQILVLYPYVVEGGFTVASKSPDTGLYDAHFGMIITDQPVCHKGYNAPQRKPTDGSNAPMDTKAHCAEPPTVSNARGAQNAPHERRAPRVGTAYDSPVVASYDPETGKLTWGSDIDPELAPTGTVAPQTLGEESWKWLFLQPLTTDQE